MNQNIACTNTFFEEVDAANEPHKGGPRLSGWLLRTERRCSVDRSGQTEQRGVCSTNSVGGKETTMGVAGWATNNDLSNGEQLVLGRFRSMLSSEQMRTETSVQNGRLSHHGMKDGTPVGFWWRQRKSYPTNEIVGINYTIEEERVAGGCTKNESRGRLHRRQTKEKNWFWPMGWPRQKQMTNGLRPMIQVHENGRIWASKWKIYPSPKWKMYQSTKQNPSKNWKCTNLKQFYQSTTKGKRGRINLVDKGMYCGPAVPAPHDCFKSSIW